MQQKESLLLSTSATFDITVPTSPQRVAAASSAQITKDYFANPENRDEKANLPWQVPSSPFAVLFLRLLAPLTLDRVTRLVMWLCVCVCARAHCGVPGQVLLRQTLRPARASASRQTIFHTQSGRASAREEGQKGQEGQEEKVKLFTTGSLAHPTRLRAPLFYSESCVG